MRLSGRKSRKTITGPVRFAERPTDDRVTTSVTDPSRATSPPLGFAVYKRFPVDAPRPHRIFTAVLRTRMLRSERTDRHSRLVYAREGLYGAVRSMAKKRERRRARFLCRIQLEQCAALRARSGYKTNRKPTLSIRSKIRQVWNSLRNFFSPVYSFETTELSKCNLYCSA